MQLPVPQQRRLLALAQAETRKETPAPQHLESQELKTAQQNHAQLRDQAARVQMHLDEIEWSLRGLNSSMRKMRVRVRDEKARLGATEDPELRREFQHDLRAAERLERSIRSQEAEAQKRIAALEAQRTHLGAEIDAALSEIERLKRANAEVEAASAAFVAEHSDDAAKIRAEFARDFPAQLAAYDQQRKEDGVGAAEFLGRTCKGCNFVLTGAAVTHIKSTPTTVLPQCPECGVYLVRA